MTPDWRECLSRPSAPAGLSNVSAYASASMTAGESPIDLFHDTLRKILAAAPPEYLISNPIVGPLFLGGVVATTEEFMRSLLGRLIAICPDAKKHAADKTIMLGSAVWHGQGVVARGAFEHVSLAGKKHVIRTVRDFINHNIGPRDRVHGVLDEYDKVCEIRHGVVHSGVTVPGMNAIKLGLPPINGTPHLRVGFSELQECANVCTALAVSLNLDLFGVMAERWASSWRDHPSWNSKDENRCFKQIWEIFFSEFDAKRKLIATPMTMAKCRNMIKREMNIQS